MAFGEGGNVSGTRSILPNGAIATKSYKMARINAWRF